MYIKDLKGKDKECVIEMIKFLQVEENNSFYSLSEMFSNGTNGNFTEEITEFIVRILYENEGLLEKGGNGNYRRKREIMYFTIDW